MQIYMIPDTYRVDGVDGSFIEKAYDNNLPRYEECMPLVSARNQYVSFQIIFDAREEGHINCAQVSFKPLVGKRESLKPDYEVFVEWFHTVGEQHIPDMLIPMETAGALKIPQSDKYVKNQKVGAMWVDLFVPTQARVGRYTGKIHVEADGQHKELTIELRVFKAVIPNESLMTADLNNYADSITPVYKSLSDNPERYRDGSYLKIERQFYKMAREHRCLFEQLNAPHSGIPPETFAPELEGRGKHIRVKSWDAYDEHYGPYLDGSAFEGSHRGSMPIEFLFTPFNLGWPANYENWGKKGYATEYRRILWEYEKHFEEKGWTNTYLVTQLNNKKDYRFFPTTQDEIWYLHDEENTLRYFDVIGDLFQLTHAKMLFRGDESNNLHRHYKDEIGEHTDLWVANHTMFGWCPECVDVIKNRGSMLWHYGWFGEGFTLDLPLTAHFTQPMAAFMTGTTGFCSFWNTLGFGKDPLDAPFVNGGQALFYPGTDIPGAPDVLPCIRLKALRNHMQLADLMMTTDGLEREANPAWRREVGDIINREFGYESDDSWWVPKPDFVEKYEPRYWDKYCKDYDALTNHHYEGQSPLLINRVREEVIAHLSRM